VWQYLTHHNLAKLQAAATSAASFAMLQALVMLLASAALVQHMQQLHCTTTARAAAIGSSLLTDAARMPPSDAACQRLISLVPLLLSSPTVAALIPAWLVLLQPLSTPFLILSCNQSLVATAIQHTGLHLCEEPCSYPSQQASGRSKLLSMLAASQLPCQQHMPRVAVPDSMITVIEAVAATTAAASGFITQ